MLSILFLFSSPELILHSFLWWSELGSLLLVRVLFTE